MAKEKTYSEKLRDPRWQKKRLEILNRDNFTCSWCKDDKNELHVHHTHYVKGREPWEYEEWSLMTLCKDCHEFTRLDFTDLEKFLFESILNRDGWEYKEVTEWKSVIRNFKNSNEKHYGQF